MQFFYESEPVRVLQEQAEYLFKDHKEEVCLFGDVALKPAWERYKNLEKLGQLAFISARKNNKIVGYTVNIVTRHLHYDFIMAVNDAIYLQKPYRGYGIRLLKATERLLKNVGAEFFSISVKPHVDYRPVLEKLGYNLLEYEYFRRL